MIEIIVILVVIGVGVIGGFAGFGRVLMALSSGLVGKILVGVACYFSFGIVLSFPFVQTLMNGLVTAIRDVDSGFLNFLLLIRLDLVIFAVCLFAILSLLRWLICKSIKKFMEIDTKFMKVLNRTLGVMLALLWLVMFSLILLQILAWATGVHGPIYQALEGSFLGLDKLFEANPLNSIISSINR